MRARLLRARLARARLARARLPRLGLLRPGALRPCALRRLGELQRLGGLSAADVARSLSTILRPGVGKDLRLLGRERRRDEQKERDSTERLREHPVAEIDTSAP